MVTCRRNLTQIRVFLDSLGFGVSIWKYECHKSFVVSSAMYYWVMENDLILDSDGLRSCVTSCLH